jgi:hypothetical protein
MNAGAFLRRPRRLWGHLGCGYGLTVITRTARPRTDMRQRGRPLCRHSLGAGTERRDREGTASSTRRSPYMSLRADRYRQRAAEAKDRAAQASNPTIKNAFQDVAAGWVLLAEQAERIERQKSPVRDEEK